ncbi:Uncharacterised protein (plasmid) [Legionella adelaidensis]|uniref:Lipoprotein n=1 Tax=Legionella adelaidensis TaxID=45056 RepID=A0A0W0R228_9GAMM|nr:hypothetical protein [Legionella adelaidensis]KTC65155.1 hypothetical protein Lade_1528 [Legionella adelaidensis]VEH85047.1 Uncharacterised protein [Legionella adelaidensis]
MRKLLLPLVLIAATITLTGCGFGACGNGCPTATYVSTASACCTVPSCNTCGYGYGYNWY